MKIYRICIFSIYILAVQCITGTASKCSRIPNVLIIGAKKCGTTALKDMLNFHPQIQAFGEIHYFDRNIKKGLRWYRKFFKDADCNVPVLLEKTPAYFATPRVAERVERMNDSIKLLLILRDPVTRLVSDFLHCQAVGEMQNTTIQDQVFLKNGKVDKSSRLLDVSTYDRHVKRWLYYFNKSQLHVVDGEQLITNPVAELQLIEAFLGIRSELTKDKFYYNKDTGFYCVVRSGARGRSRECVNESKVGVATVKGRPHPPLPADVRTQLDDYFYMHNQNLLKLLNRTLSFIPTFPPQ